MYLKNILTFTITALYMGQAMGRNWQRPDDHEPYEEDNQVIVEEEAPPAPPAPPPPPPDRPSSGLRRNDNRCRALRFRMV